ncbi:DUF2973 domain-containing protein [Acaryochloris sp. IP29b_bin.137]|uniref:DUF2973 domain-containing protein n=1 Tax=Acaryochloris sp. IP29b_bin.137 TaxID=2969217 RepID=UPI0026305ECE|nr:DUF2973 domain-containing protein [Acaryochloris sp. IP29b_bin.137]
MFQFLYMIAFIVLAVLAVGNLFRNVLTLGFLSQRDYNLPMPPSAYPEDEAAPIVPHPELLDESGNVIDEPLLVMRSMSVEDAREQLDALYHQSPGSKEDL